MTCDPSRRPSNERVRLNTDVNALIWIECASCLGDGWHFPYRGRPTRKITCGACDGLGRRQILAVHRAPTERIVPAPPSGSEFTKGN